MNPFDPEREIELPGGVDPFAKSRRSLKVRSVLLTSGIILALVTGIYLYTRSRQSALIIQTPHEVTVKLNGAFVRTKAVKEGIKVPVIAGQYRLEVDRTNFLPFTQDVTIPVGESLKVRPVFTLAPLNAEEAAGGGVSFVRSIKDQSLVYYLGDGGTRIYRVETKTQTQFAISEKSISQITDVQWPQEPDVALVTRADGTYLFEVPKFDFQTQRFEKVAGPEIKSPVWDPNSERLAAALFLPNGERTLILSDKRFTDIQRKAELTGFTNPKLIWSPESRFIAVLNRSQDSTQNNVWVYTLADGSFSAITNSGGIVDASFSPDERTVLLEKVGNQLVTHVLTDGSEHVLSLSGTVKLAAWKNAEAFYLPEPGSNALTLYSLTGNTSRIPYTLPSTAPVLGMFYFSESDSLVFYTENAVYTVSLAE